MGVQIGHINKELAVILAPLMDSNRVIIEAECIGIRTQYMQPILYSFYGKPDIREIIGLSQETKASARSHSTGPSSSRQFQLLEGSGSSRLDANNMDEFYSSTLNQEELNICEQPSMVQTKLLRHQLQALQWCRSQENLTINDEKAIQFWKKLPGGQFQNLATNSTVAQEPKLVSGGILADDMGLGKTLTMISLLASDESPETKHNLIICPLSVVENWTKQITDHLFNSNLKVYVYHGSDKSNNEKFLKKQNIVISTYQTIASVYHEKRKLGPFAINWDRVILDEGHIIKNHKTKLAKAAISIMSKNRWVVTGTPITNKIEDLYSILKFLNYTPFDSEEFWKKCFQRPIKRGLEIGNQNLRALIKDIMIRRTKATTYQGEKIVKLPKCTVYTDYLQFTTDQMVEYQRIKAVFKQRIIEFMENDSMDKNGLIVLEMLTRLRQFCDHPSLVPVGYEEKIKNSLDEANLDEARMIELLKNAYESGEECCICMEDLKEAVITCCRHMFCDPCLDTSMKTKNACPLCRRPLTAKVFIN
jgi:SWI/SNF-related matrix-associated actin-dependent regulator of chromatin subfamily A3